MVGFFSPFTCYNPGASQSSFLHKIHSLSSLTAPSVCHGEALSPAPEQFFLQYSNTLQWKTYESQTLTQYVRLATPLSLLATTTSKEPRGQGPDTARLPPTPRPSPGGGFAGNRRQGPTRSSAPAAGQPPPPGPALGCQSAFAASPGSPPGPATRGAHRPGRRRRREGDAPPAEPAAAPAAGREGRGGEGRPARVDPSRARHRPARPGRAPRPWPLPHTGWAAATPRRRSSQRPPAATAASPEGAGH